MSETNDGLVAAYLLDGHGGGRRLGWDEIARWQPADGLLWVQLAGAQPSLTVVLNLLPYRQQHRLAPLPNGWQTELILGQAELSDDHQLNLGGFAAAIVTPKVQE